MDTEPLRDLYEASAQKQSRRLSKDMFNEHGMRENDINQFIHAFAFIACKTEDDFLKTKQISPGAILEAASRFPGAEHRTFKQENHDKVAHIAIAAAFATHELQAQILAELKPATA